MSFLFSKMLGGVAVTRSKVIPREQLPKNQFDSRNVQREYVAVNYTFSDVDNFNTIVGSFADAPAGPTITVDLSALKLLFQRDPSTSFQVNEIGLAEYSVMHAADSFERRTWYVCSSQLQGYSNASYVCPILDDSNQGGFPTASVSFVGALPPLLTFTLGFLNFLQTGSTAVISPNVTVVVPPKPSPVPPIEGRLYLTQQVLNFFIRFYVSVSYEPYQIPTYGPATRNSAELRKTSEQVQGEQESQSAAAAGASGNFLDNTAGVQGALGAITGRDAGAPVPAQSAPLDALLERLASMLGTSQVRGSTLGGQEAAAQQMQIAAAAAGGGLGGGGSGGGRAGRSKSAGGSHRDTAPGLTLGPGVPGGGGFVGGAGGGRGADTPHPPGGDEHQMGGPGRWVGRDDDHSWMGLSDLARGHPGPSPTELESREGHVPSQALGGGNFGPRRPGEGRRFHNPFHQEPGRLGAPGASIPSDRHDSERQRSRLGHALGAMGMSRPPGPPGHEGDQSMASMSRRSSTATVPRGGPEGPRSSGRMIEGPSFGGAGLLEAPPDEAPAASAAGSMEAAEPAPLHAGDGALPDADAPEAPPAEDMEYHEDAADLAGTHVADGNAAQAVAVEAGEAAVERHTESGSASTPSARTFQRQHWYPRGAGLIHPKTVRALFPTATDPLRSGLPGRLLGMGLQTSGLPAAAAAAAGDLALRPPPRPPSHGLKRRVPDTSLHSALVSQFHARAMTGHVAGEPGAGSEISTRSAILGDRSEFRKKQATTDAGGRPRENRPGAVADAENRQRRLLYDRGAAIPDPAERAFAAQMLQARGAPARDALVPLSAADPDVREAAQSRIPPDDRPATPAAPDPPLDSPDPPWDTPRTHRPRIHNREPSPRDPALKRMDEEVATARLHVAHLERRMYLAKSPIPNPSLYRQLKGAQEHLEYVTEQRRKLKDERKGTRG